LDPIIGLIVVWILGWMLNGLVRDRRRRDRELAAALAAVRRWGGVLEHPADSHAWRAFGLPPPLPAGWSRDIAGGWCARVEQGHYGHRARKATWLYAFGVPELPALAWGPSPATVRVAGDGFHTAAERAAALAAGWVPLERLAAGERNATPVPFRDLLISIARSVPAS
jgi:hypothetical protein